MIWLILALLTSTLIMVCFKLFPTTPGEPTSDMRGILVETIAVETGTRPLHGAPPIERHHTGVPADSPW